MLTSILYDRCRNSLVIRGLDPDRVPEKNEIAVIKTNANENYLLLAVVLSIWSAIINYQIFYVR